MTPVRHQSDRFSWLDAGDGDALLFLHPVIAPAEFWLPQLEFFAPARRCLALDAPGYDGRRSIGLDPDGLGKRLVAFLDEVGVETADLVGLSLGAMHALYTMRVAPDRIGKVVLADTSRAFGIDPDEWLGEWLAPLDHGATAGDIAGASIDLIVHEPLPTVRRQTVVDAAMRITEVGFRAASGTIAGHDVRGHLPDLRHETLVVVGEHDGETPPEYSRALAAALPHARLEIIAGAGHLSSLEEPADFNALVEVFLAS